MNSTYRLQPTLEGPALCLPVSHGNHQGEEIELLPSLTTFIVRVLLPSLFMEDEFLPPVIATGKLTYWDGLRNQKFNLVVQSFRLGSEMSYGVRVVDAATGNSYSSLMLNAEQQHQLSEDYKYATEALRNMLGHVYRMRISTVPSEHQVGHDTLWISRLGEGKKDVDVSEAETIQHAHVSTAQENLVIKVLDDQVYQILFVHNHDSIDMDKASLALSKVVTRDLCQSIIDFGLLNEQNPYKETLEGVNQYEIEFIPSNQLQSPILSLLRQPVLKISATDMNRTISLHLTRDMALQIALRLKH